MRKPWLLFAGAILGLALAASGLLEARDGPRSLSGETAAQVGERTIRRADYERILAGVETDFRNPIDETIRRRVLDRMIDEELLVQRALDLGLAAVDRKVRGELTAGLMDSIVGEADASEPSQRDLARHFEDNVDFFTRPGRLHAETIYFSQNRDADHEGERAADRAVQAAGLLRAGEEMERIEERLGDPQVSRLPGGLLPRHQIRDYVGPNVLLALDALGVGAWSEPIPSGSGFYLARMIDREAALVPKFADIEKLVRQDLKRRRGDEALRRYLDDLRTQTRVEINPALFSDLP